jgi:sugar O-acyltransferase (sialic acid O-acetyltransferase NeuD family)
MRPCVSLRARGRPPVRDIVIFGTGGNCLDILDTIEELNRASGATVYRCLGFLDDDAAKLGREYHGARVLGPLSLAAKLEGAVFVNGIGSPANFWRKPEIIARAGVPLERFETLVHPTASVSRFARLGRGTVIFQHVTVTLNVSIGDHVVVLPNTVVSHDDVIGDYACVAGGASISAGVRVGRASYVGAGSAIRGGVTIGDGALVGMGSVVLEDVAAGAVVVGNPARFLRDVQPRA